MKSLIRKEYFISGILILLMSFTVACGQTPKATVSEAAMETQAATGSAKTNPQETAKPIELTVSAAASLKDSLGEIKSAYEEKNQNVKLTFSFGSSGSLQQQIENGAGVDVFISAATKQMDALQKKDLILVETRREFLQNEIVLIVPKDSGAISDFKDLTSGKIKHIALGEPKGVPVGQYSEEVLKKLDILDKIKKKVVYGNDVKEVLTWVGTGNADAGIVYATDAQVSDKVKVVAVAPRDSHKPVYYPAAVIKSSKNTEAAKAFTQYLYSKEAKPVFEKYGFLFIEK